MSRVSESISQGLQEILDHVNSKIVLDSHYVSITPPKHFSADEVRLIRANLKMSQRFFADVLGVSKRTVEAWEHGRNTPSGAASRLLTIAESDPGALKRFAQW